MEGTPSKPSVLLLYATCSRSGGNHRTCTRISGALSENGFSSRCVRGSDLLELYASEQQRLQLQRDPAGADNDVTAQRRTSSPSDGQGAPIGTNTRHGGNGNVASPSGMCACSHPHPNPHYWERHAVDWFCREHRIGYIVACHAYRCHRYLTGCSVPYSIIFGGTDINHDVADSEKRSAMTPVVSLARHAVCFSADVQERALAVWPALSDKLIIQGHGIQRSLPNAKYPSLLPWLRSQSGMTVDVPDDAKVFMLVAGIRPVKDPLFVVDVFDEWHGQDPSVFLVIIGDVLNKDCFGALQQRLSRCDGVVYAPPVEEPLLHHLFQECTAVLNTSLSEGMGQAPMEAMAHGVPVILRDIAGNRCISEHRNTGLLFSSPQECVDLARELAGDPALRSSLVRNALHFMEIRHSPAAEAAEYCRIVTSG